MRQLAQYPVATLRVNPGGPAVRDRFQPPNIQDPNQHSVVTRYGIFDDTARAAVVTAAFADPNVIAWQTAHSISGADWTSLQALITASIAPSASQLFPFEMQMAATEAPDVAAFAVTTGSSANLKFNTAINSGLLVAMPWWG